MLRRCEQRYPHLLQILYTYLIPSFPSQLPTRALVPLGLIGASAAYHAWRGSLVKALPTSLWITFLVFSLVSSPAFRAFDCELFEGGTVSYLRADYSLVCMQVQLTAWLVC